MDASSTQQSIVKPFTDVYRDCPECHFSTMQDAAECPKCGAPLQDEKEIRKQGSLYVAMGFLLSLMTGGIAIGLFLLWFLATRTHALGVTVKDPDSLGVFMMIAIIFCLGLFSYGVLMFYAGRHQDEHGRRDRYLLKMAGIVLIVTLVFAGLVRIFLD